MNFDLLNNSNIDIANMEDDIVSEKIVLAKQQRNGRKYWTLLENFKAENPKKFIKIIKKNGHCNGNYNEEENVFQFQGVQIELMKGILIEHFGVSEDNIVIRG